jgi:signal transduction histidine kinase
VTLAVAYAATSGDPVKLAAQRLTVPGLMILVAVTAAATAVVGATVPVLASHGALPVTVGPLATAMGGAGLQIIQLAYLDHGSPGSSTLTPAQHLNTTALLWLVLAAAVAVVGVGHLLAVRRADRRHAEQIRREAAERERERLARPIHDGVLQVLALVQRQGADLGDEGARLAALAGEQEVALRTLLTGGVAVSAGAATDLRTPLRGLATPAVEVNSPGAPVLLPASSVSDLTAAVRAALDNVARHAGPGARAWILIEQEPDGVRVTVRDDGTGFDTVRLDEAAAEGRLGVAQSMRGRIADLGGRTTFLSTPGEGTEVEFWLPR